MQYRGLHNWVERYLGKPQECWCCGANGKRSAKFYQWANISGNYEQDLQDWARLCASCHMTFDGRLPANLLFRELCSNGHKLTIDLLYLGSRQQGALQLGCRECRRNQVRKHRLRKQEALL